MTELFISLAAAGYKMMSSPLRRICNSVARCDPLRRIENPDIKQYRIANPIQQVR